MAKLNAEQQADRLVNHIAYLVQSLRDRERLRQDELADRCGLRQQTISKLERGDYRRNEFIVSALKVAAYFNLDPSALFFGHAELSPEALFVAKTWEAAPENVRRSAQALLNPL